MQFARLCQTQSKVLLGFVFPALNLNMGPKASWENTMRKSLVPLAAAALFWGQYTLAQTQDTSQNAPKPASKSAMQNASMAQAQQKADAGSNGQPMSLAEMARLARAKRQSSPNAKKTAAKPEIVLDDDNMPRGVYADDTPSGDNPAEAPGSTPPGLAPSGSPPIEFRGKVVLLDFWASWCGPCRGALPNLKKLQEVYGGGDFVVVSISEDDDESAWRTFVSNHHMSWPQRLDTGGSLQRQYGVRALPTYVLIGRDGSVIRKFVGEELAASILERIGPDLKTALSAEQ